ncbi:gamma-glutamylcyclotransferase [Candidatus Woesearchaeota archaeon]|nr:gamma-glutamylcyclotransferase [Candidatus Woesearchaeota archaeon]
MVFYFAYGSNMNKERMISRGVSIKKRFSGILQNWKLNFSKINDEMNGAGFASIILSENSKVEGVIYETDEQSIKQLDKYEGYPYNYSRKNIVIKDKNGREFKCIVYIANPDKTKAGLKPTKEYLSHLLEGKSLISEDYYKVLESTETIHK